MDSLAIAFMAVVVGSLLYIQLQLHQIGKNLKPKDNSRDASENEPDNHP